jgi:hypothetical protein
MPFAKGRGPPCAQLSLARGLLSALERMDSAPVDELFREGEIRTLVRRVGLQRSTNTIRRKRGAERYNNSMWGEEVEHELATPDMKKAQGMWQVPAQFECAVRHLRRAFSPPHAPLKRSLTVGTWSGWTDVVMTALLRRVSPELRHATFDVANYVDTCISEQFSRYSIQQVRHGWYGGKESWPELGIDSWDGSWPANFSAPVVDFCLIDGGHSYTLASRDFKTLRTGCRVIAFHDIVNVRVGLTEVPRLWRELTDPTHERSAPEFESVNCTQQPRWGDGQLMGIGLLVRKEGAAGRWQYPPPEQKPFPLDPADALGASRQAQLDSIWNDFA